MIMEINDYKKFHFLVSPSELFYFSRPWSRGHKNILLFHSIIRVGSTGEAHHRHRRRHRTAQVARSAWMFFYVLFEKSIKSRFRFQVYTRLNYLKFEIPKISGEGLTEPPPQTPPPALSRASPSIRASPSNLGRSAPSIRASPDSDPPNFWSVAAPLVLVLQKVREPGVEPGSIAWKATMLPLYHSRQRKCLDCVNITFLHL